MKKSLSLILALVMLIGLLPQTMLITYAVDHASVNNALAGKTIACVGDSITAAYGVTKDETDYVTLLARQLDMDYIRLGASGTTLCTDGSRTCNIGKLTEANLQSADIVTIAMGINDFCAAAEGYYELGDIDSTDSSTIYGAMRMWCERIEELRKTDSLRDTQFYFVTPVITSWNNSVTSARDWDQSKKNIHGYTLRDLCNAIMEVAALYDVAVIDMNLLSGMYYVDAQDNNTAVFGGDGVHPGVKGHEMMAAAMANILLQNHLRDDHTHTFGSWITTTWPSCSGGEQKRVCTICSATESRPLESSDSHRYSAVVTAPTYTEHGYTTYTCSLCGDSYVSNYTDPIVLTSYRWEMQNNVLVSVTTDGNTDNALTMISGSITNGTLSGVRYTLQNTIRLLHDEPWVIEWRSSGNWDGMLLGSTLDSSVQGLAYLFRYAPMNFLAFGEYTGTWNNYGIIHDIDMTASHVFRLENRIAEDGSNAAYLLVDGQEVGVMHHYYVGGTNKNETVNWADGRDIVFSNIGTSSHPVKNMNLDYLQVWESDHAHSYESTVTAPTCTEAGYTVYRCATCGSTYVDDYVDATGEHTYENGICTGCSKVDPSAVPAKLYMYSISLKGNIAINYYMELSSEVVTDATAFMCFTFADNSTTEIPVSKATPRTRDGKDYYVFSCAVDAKEMMDVVKAQFFYNGGATEEYGYNVQSYAQYFLENSTDEGLKTLVEAMLNYGAASQLHFGYNTDNLANDCLDSVPDYSDVSIDGFTTAAGQGTELAKFYSASLILKSETTLRFFFTGSFTATYNGNALEVKERDGLYYTDVVGISAKDLDEDVTITINDGESSADVTYNPMAYCAAVRNDESDTFDQKMKNLVSALYLYTEAANTYLEKN